MNAHQRRQKRRTLHKLDFDRGLSAGDRSELKRFATFLKDDATMSPREVVAKHGEYMGLRPSEVAAVLNKEAAQ